jgi:OOP family OmpA-OmpF porin
VLDDGDECIDQPEVKNGYKDEDGCPDTAPDKDKDGIPDTVDKCPNKPENVQRHRGRPTAARTRARSSCKVGRRHQDPPARRVRDEQGQDPGREELRRCSTPSVGALKLHPDIFLARGRAATRTASAVAADNKTLSAEARGRGR